MPPYLYRPRCIRAASKFAVRGWRSRSTDKDTFLSAHQDWSTSTCIASAGSCVPPYYGAQEKHPELQALVSALSAGPIAPGDVVRHSTNSCSLLIQNTPIHTMSSTHMSLYPSGRLVECDAHPQHMPRRRRVAEARPPGVPTRSYVP